MIHKNNRLFLPHLPNSSVVSATVYGEEVEDLSTPVVITLTPDVNVC